MRRRCPPADIAARRWNLLAGDLPLPLAALDRDALAHNIQWMQAYARSQGVDLAPHGKTTMSPQLFQRQLDAGAWGITFANVFQLARRRGCRRAPCADRQPVGAGRRAGGACSRCGPRTPTCASCSWSIRCSSCGESKRGHACTVARHSRRCSRSAWSAAAPGFATRETRLRWRAQCEPAPRCGWSASSVMRGSARPAKPIATPNTPRH